MFAIFHKFIPNAIVYKGSSFAINWHAGYIRWWMQTQHVFIHWVYKVVRFKTCNSPKCSTIQFFFNIIPSYSLLDKKYSNFLLWYLTHLLDFIRQLSFWSSLFFLYFLLYCRVGVSRIREEMNRNTDMLLERRSDPEWIVKRGAPSL